MKNFYFLFIVCTMSIAGSGCSSTIYLVRHAEKATVTNNMMSSDPDLSAAGTARAAALASTMKAIDLNGIFATQYKRTQQTAEPTATQKGLPVNAYNASAGAALLDSLAHRQNKKFLVVGHSNIIPAMLRSIGLQPSMQDIAEDDYDNLFVVKINWFFARSISLLEKTYGKPSP